MSIALLKHFAIILISFEMSSAIARVAFSEGRCKFGRLPQNPREC